MNSEDTEVVDLIAELKRRQVLRPAKISLKGLGSRDINNFPCDLVTFLNEAGDWEFDFWRFTFAVYNAKSLGNINEFFFNQGWSDRRYKEYDQCYIFSHTLDSYFNLGVDISQEHFGWVFFYLDSAEGVSRTGSGFLFRSVKEFLIALKLRRVEVDQSPPIRPIIPNAW